MQSNFLLGALHITPEARMVLKRQPFDLLARHALNEHGFVTKSEQKINERSMLTIGPIKSRYKADPTKFNSKMILIQTDSTWSHTHITVE